MSLYLSYMGSITKKKEYEKINFETFFHIFENHLSEDICRIIYKLSMPKYSINDSIIYLDYGGRLGYNDNIILNIFYHKEKNIYLYTIMNRNNAMISGHILESRLVLKNEF